MMPSDESLHQPHPADLTRPAILLCLLIVLVCAAVGGVVWLLPDWQTRGQFGDMFGVANALFSGGALVGVIVAVLLQRRQLQLQYEELRRAATAQERSNQGLLDQTRLQTTLLNAQLVKDRLELYWDTYRPVTKQQVEELHLYPADYMAVELYEKRYKSDDAATRRYIYMSQLYEYLAFTHALQVLGVPDPLGSHWVRGWTTDLIESHEFLDVNEQYGGYYPEFKSFVDSLRESARTDA